MPPSDDQSRARGPSDPFELWRQIYETNERAWNAVLERTVNNPAFAESSGKILETFLSAQKTVRDNMRQYLEQVNLPTREDIARLGELIVALEEKVDLLDDRLGRIERSVDGGLAGIERSLAARVNAPASSSAAIPSSSGSAPTAPSAAAAPSSGSASTAAARAGTASLGSGGTPPSRKVDRSAGAPPPAKTPGGVTRGSGARGRTPKDAAD